MKNSTYMVLFLSFLITSEARIGRRSSNLGSFQLVDRLF